MHVVITQYAKTWAHLAQLRVSILKTVVLGRGNDQRDSCVKKQKWWQRREHGWRGQHQNPRRVCTACCSDVSLTLRSTPTITILTIEKVNLTYTENLQILSRLITDGDSIEINRLMCTGTSRIPHTQFIKRRHNTGAFIEDVDSGGLMPYRKIVCVCV
jgi:hypothetical protein